MNNLSLQVDDDGLAILTFDRPESSANIFDLETLDELEKVIGEIETNDSIRQLVITSAKSSIFIAGADIKYFSKASLEELDDFLKRGQELFDRINKLKIGTAAAIHGACLGGGFELTLACDVRVASDSKKTKIGLPETQLGIIPAWGGSTRLPKLIGVQKALPLILAAKQMAPKYAKKLGAVDDVVARERMVTRCVQLLNKHPKSKSLWKQNNMVSRRIAKRVALKQTMEKTRGHYPALLRAIDVVTGSPGTSHRASLNAERKVTLALSETDATKQMIRLFFLNERAKRSGVDCIEPVPDIDHVSVIGAGVMGAGIAHWTASRGVPVLLKDISAEAVAKGMKTISKRFHQAVSRRIFTKGEAATRMNLISPVATDVPMQRVDLVIEAAVENMEIKKKIFADLADRSRNDTILATNTSALSISDLASAIDHPERVVGIHFFNPVHRMKLVEVIYTSQTKPEVSQACMDFVRKLGKMPVLVKDSPGFLVNRILMPYLIEAGRLLELGVDAKKIDEAMLNFGMPVGPIQLLDDIGLDVALHVAETMEASFEARMKSPQILSDLVEADILGRKSGKGIFLYDKANKGNINEAAQKFVKGSVDMSEEEIYDRLTLLMVAESYRCLEEGVVDSKDDVDYAMILGTGWAPFRGGPIAYAEHIGEQEVSKKLKVFRDKDGITYDLPKSLSSSS